MDREHRPNVKAYTPRADKARVRRGGTFTQWLAEQGYSPRTVRLYTQTVRRASTFLSDERHTTLARAAEDDLHAFLETVPPTRSSRAGVRYALVAYYKAQGRARGYPADKLPLPPAPYRLPRPFGADTLRDLLAAARLIGGRHQVIAEMLAYTACRRNEMRTAAWHQFDLSGSSPVWYVAGKGAQRRGPKPRQVPLHPTLLVTLNSWRIENGHSVVVFPSDRSADGILSTSTVGKLVGEICEQAGVQRLNPHQWRHTGATIALERTRDLRGVQELLGHSSLASTQIYTAVTQGRLSDIVTALGV